MPVASLLHFTAQALYDGESYEVCLTTMLSRRGSVPPAQQLYGTLRRVNPAPYAGASAGVGLRDVVVCAALGLPAGLVLSLPACWWQSPQYTLADAHHPSLHPPAAWLRFGAGSDALQLCCCSPERFLRGGRGGLLEAKPIKGTAPRSSDPEQDARAAAELAGERLLWLRLARDERVLSC